MKKIGASANLAKDSTAQKLRKLLPVCSVCMEALRNHHYLQLATSFRESTVAEMLRLVRTHQWAELLTCEEWNPEANALVVYAIAGAHEAGMVTAIKSSHELFESDEVLLTEKLPPEDMRNLFSSTDGKAWLLL